MKGLYIAKVPVNKLACIPYSDERLKNISDLD